MADTNDTLPGLSPPEQGEPVFMIIGYEQTPVMGGYRLSPPLPICLVQGEERARRVVKVRDDYTEPAHFGLQIAQPWYTDDDYFYDPDGDPN